MPGERQACIDSTFTMLLRHDSKRVTKREGVRSVLDPIERPRLRTEAKTKEPLACRRCVEVTGEH